METLKKMVQSYIVTNDKNFSLQNIDPDDSGGMKNKKEAEKLLAQSIQRLSQLQDILYAHDRWGVLLIFQAMDAAGKDGAIKHVMSGVNPQGCEVHSFKTPSAQEQDHDFLWRCAKVAPERGRIGIFNRSYYEETLVVRVHPEFLKAEKLPARFKTERIWGQRFKDIRAYERYMARNGFVIRKFFLHVSRAEQKKRFLARIKDPDKNWKFSMADIQERGFWERYMHAYEETIRHTAAPWAPWVVLPANHKWFTRLMVAAAVIDALEGIPGLAYPQVDDSQRQLLKQAGKLLDAEDT